MAEVVSLEGPVEVFNGEHPAKVTFRGSGVATGRSASRIYCMPPVQRVRHFEPPPFKAELNHSLPNFLRHNENLSWSEHTDAGTKALARSDHIASVRGSFDRKFGEEVPTDRTWDRSSTA